MSRPTITAVVERTWQTGGRLRALLGGLLSGTLGAVGFLTRLPVGTSGEHWGAFRRRPTTMVPVAGLLGLALSVPVLVPLPRVTAALLFPVWLLVLTGITHLDGLADLGDAAVVHGTPADRRSVMRETTVGVGALAASTLGIAGLVLAAHAIAVMSRFDALAVVVIAEVSAKLGMVAVASLGTATHEGLGSELTADAGPGTLAVGCLCALPVAGLSWPGFEAVATLAGSLAATTAVLLWARKTLGGVSGDVFGAINEIARVVALHVGVIAWTL